MSFYFLNLVFIYFFIYQNRINCNEEYKYINISSFEEYQINLIKENYFILKYYNSKLEDIVCQLNEPIKNGIILVYNDLKNIKKDEYGNFINYKWKFKENISAIIKSNDTNFIKESDYFFVFYSNQSGLYRKIIIFNENDIKKISTRENFLIKQVFSKKKFEISYSLSDFALIFFIFDFPQKNNKEISIIIQNEKKNTIKRFDKIGKDFIYEYDSKEKKNTTYYIILETEESYEKVNLNFNIEIKLEKEELISEKNQTKILQANHSFLFYINIKNYLLKEENTIEIELTKEFLSKDFEINNQLINDDNIIKEPTECQFNYSIREIKGLDYYYFFIPFKKLNTENKFLIFNIKYKGKNNPKVDILLTKRISEQYINKKNISDCNLTIPILASYRRYIKLKFIDGFPSKKNVLIYIGEKNSLILYQGNLLQKGTNNPNENYSYQQLFIINKNNINKNFENTITIGLKGNSGSILIQIRTESNNIIFNNDFRSYNKTFFFELINCKEKLYFIETYDNENIELNYAIFESFYGDFNISYLSPIENIDFKKSKKKILEKKIFQNNFTSIVYLIKCKTPTSLRLRYVKELNEKKKISEGEEIIGILKKDKIEYEINNTNKLVLQLESNHDIQLKLNDEEKNITKNNKTFYSIDNIKNIEIYNNTKENEDCLIKLFISSSTLYTTIIEGNSEIEYSKNKVLFKFRNDILYDYISFEIIPKRGVKKINLFYDLIKMKEYKKKYILPNPTKYYSFENKYTMKISNPYNKYNSQIDKNEYVFLIFHFTNKEEDFNIYINIRYFYNNQIEDIKSEEIYNYVETNRIYRIFGNNKKDKDYMLVMNVNKCNNLSRYNLTSYYEDENNKIKKKKIEKDETFLYHENLYNNTQLELKNLRPTENITDDGILLNYFFLKKKDFKKYSYEDNFKITLKDDGRKVNISWSEYLFNEKDETVSTNYSLFILYKNNSINGICELINLTPNKTLVDKNTVILYLAEGDYKINIIAYSLDSNYPVYSIYEELIVNIPPRSFAIYIVIGIICFIIIGSLILIIFIYSGKKNKNKKKRDFNVSGVSNTSSSNEELIPVDD